MANLKQKVELYDPHPGFAGAAVPLPKSMKEFADELNGQQMTLEEALEKLSPVAEDLGGAVQIVGKMKYIGFTYFESSGRQHYFRLLRYK
ncbi:MAG: hypothetical protein KKA62_01505 [Nanoarchaeota archaeon]|nr:hypothetical protein [Nanoarchaeota archaeon]MBU1976609.1 hypothetical protein [Nanoarchaeota archaeon]